MAAADTARPFIDRDSDVCAFLDGVCLAVNYRVAHVRHAYLML
ncbi:MAG: hypothetical protein ABW318_15380 [Vicinamibacterales bacterium]